MHLNNVISELKSSGIKYGDFAEALKQKLCAIASSLGVLISLDLYHDSRVVTKQCQDVEEMKLLKSNSWLTDRNLVLTLFPVHVICRTAEITETAE